MLLDCMILLLLNVFLFASSINFYWFLKSEIMFCLFLFSICISETNLFRLVYQVVNLAAKNDGLVATKKYLFGLPNTVENLVLQVACSRLGVSIATMKSANEALVLKGFAALADAGQAPKGAVVLEMVTKSSNQNR